MARKQPERARLADVARSRAARRGSASIPATKRAGRVHREKRLRAAAHVIGVDEEE